jgi:hypothetical protein
MSSLIALSWVGFLDVLHQMPQQAGSIEKAPADMLSEAAITFPLRFVEKLVGRTFLRESFVVAVIFEKVGRFLAGKRRLDYEKNRVESGRRCSKGNIETNFGQRRLRFGVESVWIPNGAVALSAAESVEVTEDRSQ